MTRLPQRWQPAPKSTRFLDIVINEQGLTRLPKLGQCCFTLIFERLGSELQIQIRQSNTRQIDRWSKRIETHEEHTAGRAIARFLSIALRQLAFAYTRRSSQNEHMTLLVGKCHCEPLHLAVTTHEWAAGRT